MMKFDVIVIGGGLAGITAARELANSALDCAVVMSGKSVSDPDWSDYEGTVFKSDTVLGGTFDGNKLSSLSTSNFGRDALVADFYILATGKYAGCGIKTAKDSIFEPLLGLDVASDPDRSKWFNPDFFAPQPFMSFGVKVDADMRAFRNGVLLDNVFAAGEVLEGISITDRDSLEKIASSAVKAAKSVITLCRIRA